MEKKKEEEEEKKEKEKEEKKEEDEGAKARTAGSVSTAVHHFGALSDAEAAFVRRNGVAARPLSELVTTSATRDTALRVLAPLAPRPVHRCVVVGEVVVISTLQ